MTIDAILLLVAYNAPLALAVAILARVRHHHREARAEYGQMLAAASGYMCDLRDRQMALLTEHGLDRDAVLGLFVEINHVGYLLNALRAEHEGVGDEAAVRALMELGRVTTTLSRCIEGDLVRSPAGRRTLMDARTRLEGLRASLAA